MLLRCCLSFDTLLPLRLLICRYIILADAAAAFFMLLPLFFLRRAGAATARHMDCHVRFAIIFA